MRQKILSFLSGFLLLFSFTVLIIPVLVPAAHAALENSNPRLIVPIQGINGEGVGNASVNPGQYVRVLYQWSIGLAALLAMGQFVVGGIQYILSAGSLSSKESANERMKSAAGGLFVLLVIVIVLTAINPNLLNIKLPELAHQTITGSESVSNLTLDALLSHSRAQANTTRSEDLVGANADPDKIAEAEAAIQAASLGTAEAAEEARAAGVSNNGSTGAEARKNPFYKATDELASQGGQENCDDDLADIKGEIDEFVSDPADDPDMSELIGPDGWTDINDNGDFAEVLEQGYRAESQINKTRDAEKATAQATVRCKRAAVLHAVEYARQQFTPAQYRTLAAGLRTLPRKYNIELYFAESSKLFEGL